MYLLLKYYSANYGSCLNMELYMYLEAYIVIYLNIHIYHTHVCMYYLISASLPPRF